MGGGIVMARARAVLCLVLLLATSSVAVAEESYDPRPGEVISRGSLSALVPEAGHEVYVSELRTTGTETLQIATDSHGRVKVKHKSSNSSADPNLSPDDALEEVQGCVDDAYLLDTLVAVTPVEWWYNNDNQPFGSGVSLAAIQAAVANIVNGDNNCAMPDTISATQTYKGSTTAIPRVACTNPADVDGKNVVGWGALASPALGSICIWSTEGVIDEWDFKLDTSSRNWFVGSPDPLCPVEEYDIESVATHEFGNAFGLDDLAESSHRSLTMSEQIRKCSTSARTLGRGDMLGLEELY